MIIDAHVYCLMPRVLDVNTKLPDSESAIARAIYMHEEGEYALNLSKIENIKSSMEESGIDKACLVSFPWTSAGLCKENNDYILSVSKNSEDFYSICSIQPLDQDCIDEIDSCVDRGAIGFKINPNWQDYELDSDAIDNVCERVVRESKFLMIHIDHAYKKSLSSPAHLFNLASKYPDLRIIATHMGGALGFYNANEFVRNTLKNVWFDTAISSTLGMVKSYVDFGLEDNLIFGTDFPFNHSHSQKQVVEGLKELNFNKDVKKKIFADNFLHLIGDLK